MKTDLSNKTGPELVTLFNDAAKKAGVDPVKRFASRDAGVVRILKLLAGNPKVHVDEPVKKSVNPVVLAATKKYDFDEKPRRTKEKYRETSGRGKLVGYLREGHTFRYLQGKFPEWSAAHLAGNIRALSRVLGFGIKQSDSGVITLFD